MEISESTLVEDLVRSLPASAGLLAARGLVCIRCGEPYWGTLGELAASKGVRELKPILAELQNLAKTQEAAT